MAVSQRVNASTLEEVDLGTSEASRPVNVAKEMPPGKQNGDDRIVERVQGRFRFILWRHAGVGPEIVPVLDTPQQRC